MMPYGNQGGSAVMWASFLFMLLFWVVLILGIVALVTWVAKQGRPPAAPSDEAREILKRRYAKGELTKEEFESMRQDLAG